MTDNPTARAIGTALIVSEDAVATRQIAEAMQELALSVEVCNKVSDAMDRVNHSKLEVAVIDFSLGTQATRFLEQLRGSASNRTAVAFAITGSFVETVYALKAGSSFALERPLTFDSLRNTLQAAYGDEYHRALVMSDYHNWALLFIGAWFLSGAIPSAAVVRIFFAPKAGKGRD